MCFLKTYWKLAIFIAMLAAVDYGVARIVCQINGWPAHIAWLLAPFAVSVSFFWSRLADFSTKQFFVRGNTWGKLRAGVAVILGVSYALAVYLPQVKQLEDCISLVIIVPFLVFVTKWCASTLNVFIGAILSAPFDFEHWRQVNREGWSGLRRYEA